ncbi:MAG: hypothetical protein AB1742_06325 [bacterium]
MTKKLFPKLFAISFMGISFLCAIQCLGDGSKKSQLLEKNTHKINPADGMSIKNILPKIKDSVVRMNSYSYRASLERRIGLSGKKPQKNREDMRSNRDELPDVEQFEADIKFMKPYLFQARIIRSNFGPEGAAMTYRPDKDDGVFKVKAKMMPFAMKRKIEKEKGGRLLVLTFPVAFTTLSYYANSAGGSISIPGTTLINKEECYILRINIEKQSKPFMNMNSLDGEFGIPEPIKEIVLENIGDRIENGITRIDYFIKTDNFLPVLIEEYAGGELYTRIVFANIKLNNLSEKDF